MNTNSPLPFREDASVLILENSQIGQDLLSDFLQQADLSFAFMKDVNQLKDVFIRAKPRLILFDLDMPGIHIRDFVRLFRAEDGKHSIPLVALTAGDVEAVQYNCFEAGVDAILSKPVKKVELAGIITIFIPA
ncbi:response regulator [Pedobacter sp. AW1-32]|uniref:response regulator n=1 Tax=Pedobacter sp. AW1-32 TaxID=3383026 RepID=UPI003FF07029